MSTIHNSRYGIKKLPNYLIFHIKRFNHTAFNAEKNCTMMNFPLRDLNVPLIKDGVVNYQKYSLVASICHAGDHKDGKYFVYVCSMGGKAWYMIEDLLVEEVDAQAVFLSEAYIQIWEKS